MVSDGASVAPCCIVHGYRRAFAFGYRIVLKSMGMFPHCLGHEFQSDSKAGSMGGVPGQSGYGYCVRFRHPERISSGIKQKGSQPTRLEANSPTRLMMQI